MISASMHYLDTEDAIFICDTSHPFPRLSIYCPLIRDHIRVIAHVEVTGGWVVRRWEIGRRKAKEFFRSAAASTPDPEGSSLTKDVRRLVRYIGRCTADEKIRQACRDILEAG